MSAPVDCPGMERWQALLAAALPPDQCESCERHLESCPACQERLDRAVACDDKLLRLARGVGDPTGVPADAALSQIVERLHETRSPVRAAGEEPADLYFLRPADRPGVLGFLGEYEVQEVIGVGGMGIVLKAFDPALHRLVAIKVMAAALAGSATARRRFTREAQAAAAVSHDHVVAVHGVHEANGLPYLVMQYVAGESLQGRLDRIGPLEVVEAVRIALQTASGLAAAHAQGLIHRDIKPANLLLENGLARVKITDFGLARTADDVRLTRCGEVAGTPEYMAPEQARGEPIDHRADLFSLGSVLYATCTGVPPFRGSTTVAVLRRVSDEPPPSIRSLNPDTPAWLEAVVAWLMAKDPAERFQSAAEVVALLEGCLAHLREPATAPLPGLPPAPGGGPKSSQSPLRAGKLRVIRWPFWLAAAVLLAALGLPWGAAALKQEVLSRVDPAIRTADPPAADDPAAPAAPSDNAADEQVWTLAFSPDGRRLVTGSAHQMQPGQLQIWDVDARKSSATRRPSRGVRSTAYSPDGQVLATGHWEGDVKLRDPLTGEEGTTLSGHENGVNALAFSADSALLASAGLDGLVKVWDVRARREQRTFRGHTGMVLALAFFHHGRAFVTGGEDRTVRIWDPDADKERFVLRGHGAPVETAAVSPDDKIVASGDWDGDVKLWDATSGQETADLRQKTGSARALAFAPDGAVLASAGSDGMILFWDVASRNLLASIRQHNAGVRTLAFSPDGRLLASGGQDGVVRLWDMAAGRNVATLPADGASGGAQ